jgi:hypothetical protein
LGLAACDLTPVTQGEAPPEPGVLAATRNGPVGAAPGSCWGKTVSPAVVQTVEQQVQIKPAQVNPDGTIAAPPKYRRTARQEIVSPRVDNWFETPCAEVLTPEFIATLQRALSVRGFYAGSANGMLDAPTRAAVQTFQRDEGPNSPVLSLAAARKLGLIAVARPASE